MIGKKVTFSFNIMKLAIATILPNLINSICAIVESTSLCSDPIEVFLRLGDKCKQTNQRRLTFSYPVIELINILIIM